MPNQILFNLFLMTVSFPAFADVSSRVSVPIDHSPRTCVLSDATSGSWFPAGFQIFFISEGSGFQAYFLETFQNGYPNSPTQAASLLGVTSETANQFVLSSPTNSLVLILTKADTGKETALYRGRSISGYVETDYQCESMDLFQ